MDFITLIAVDVQKDFTEGGALGCEGGKKVAADLAEFITEHEDYFDLYVSSQDWHDADNDNGGHFADEPDFKDSWVHHCVAGTEGAELESPLREDMFQINIRKGQGKPAYSAFDGVDTKMGESLNELLGGVTKVIVTGIALDYCVKATALDAAKAGFDTVVALDYTACVDPSNTDKVIAELEAAGVHILRGPLG